MPNDVAAIRETAVGFIGTGKVGAAVASVAARLGAPVVLYNRTRATAEALAEKLGASVAAHPREVASRCTVVFGCLAGPEAIEDAYHGPDGMLAGASDAVSFVELCMLAPDQVQQIAESAARSNVGFLYAAVSGRPLDLQEGRGFVMSSGSDEVNAVVDVILRQLGTVRHLGGDPTHAAVMKLVMNLAVFSALCGTAEALALAASANIEPSTAYDLLLEGPVGSSLLQLRREAFLTPDGTSRVQASLDLLVKNYDVILGFAATTGAATPQAVVTARIAAEACAAGYGGRDSTTLAAYLRDLSRRNATAAARRTTPASDVPTDEGMEQITR